MDRTRLYPLLLIVQREDFNIPSEIVPLVVKPQPPDLHLKRFSAVLNRRSVLGNESTGYHA